MKKKWMQQIVAAALTLAMCLTQGAFSNLGGIEVVKAEGVNLLVNGGTLSSSYKTLLVNSKYQVPLLLSMGSNIYLKLYNTAYDNTTAYYRNILDSAHTTQYEVAITINTGEYIVTQIQ